MEYDRLSLNHFLVYQIFPYNYTHTVALSMGKMVKVMYPIHSTTSVCIFGAVLSVCVPPIDHKI